MSSSLVTRIVASVEAGLDEIVEASVERFWHQVPAYAASLDPDLRANVTMHTRAIYVAVLETLRQGRPAERGDFPITSEQATLRLRAGLELADFLAAFRIGQVTLWEGIVAVARSPRMRDAALGVATHLMQVIELGSTVASEAFLAAQQAELAEGDRVLGDLVEDLLAGREPAGQRSALALSFGLDRAAPLVVVVAVPDGPLRPGQSLRSALGTIRTAIGEDRGIVVIRQDQILGLLPVAGDGSRAVRHLKRAHTQVGRQGLRLVVGTSTVHHGLSGVPEAYREAVIARDSLGGTPGVRALSMLSTLDYMVLRDDPTARRLIRPELRQFVEEDLARDGGLVRTLMAYVECDLNAKTAAERLHVHVNTAYYRLERISERTGCDLRNFRELEELVIAVRLIGTE
ncbi:MAG TPA: helix-turn-helix domain-containing protein [Nocardioides sp.]|nr:helix-turn-helix domain-containing protein [Nocardioides sp.]